MSNELQNNVFYKEYMEAQKALENAVSAEMTWEDVHKRLPDVVKQHMFKNSAEVVKEWLSLFSPQTLWHEILKNAETKEEHPLPKYREILSFNGSKLIESILSKYPLVATNSRLDAFMEKSVMVYRGNGSKTGYQVDATPNNMRPRTEFKRSTVLFMICNLVEVVKLDGAIHMHNEAFVALEKNAEHILMGIRKLRVNERKAESDQVKQAKQKQYAEQAKVVISEMKSQLPSIRSSVTAFATTYADTEQHTVVTTHLHSVKRFVKDYIEICTFAGLDATPFKDLVAEVNTILARKESEVATNNQ